jgi:hypothetical protein
MMANTANYICHKAEIGFSGDLKILKQEEIINGLGLSRENINMFIERLRTDRSQVDSVLNALS